MANEWIQSLNNKAYQKDGFDFEALAKSAKTEKTTTIIKCQPATKQNLPPIAAAALDADYEIENVEKEEMEKQYEDKIIEKEVYKNKELQEISNKLEANGYTANTSILYALYNAMLLNKPILIEGEPGVGKTSLAKAFAQAYDMELIKVQFYDGITSNDILYEYDYGKQMLYMNAIRKNLNNELKGLNPSDALKKMSKSGVDFFGKDFLIERPLLRAISGDKRCVLLLDEIDKSEEDVEFMLLEILDTYTMTIPEYGTVTCKPNAQPIVFLTSNKYRELSAAMKRRCIYLYIEPKTVEETAEIIVKNSNVSGEFALNVAQKIREIRNLNLKQKPSISDAINWAAALFAGMGIDAFNNEHIEETLGVLVKNKSDIEQIKAAKLLK